MRLIGKYVATFAEATHALPQHMHMNADYPFILAAVVRVDGQEITIVGRGGRLATATIRRRGASEYFKLGQSSTFEQLFHRRPTTFEFHPFRREGVRA